MLERLNIHTNVNAFVLTPKIYRSISYTCVDTGHIVS